MGISLDSVIERAIVRAREEGVTVGRYPKRLARVVSDFLSESLGRGLTPRFDDSDLTEMAFRMARPNERTNADLYPVYRLLSEKIAPVIAEYLLSRRSLGAR